MDQAKTLSSSHSFPVLAFLEDGPEAETVPVFHRAGAVSANVAITSSLRIHGRQWMRNLPKNDPTVAQWKIRSKPSGPCCLRGLIGSSPCSTISKGTPFVSSKVTAIEYLY